MGNVYSSIKNTIFEQNIETKKNVRDYSKQQPQKRQINENHRISSVPKRPNYLKFFDSTLKICALPNFGTTCYFNSIMQILYHLPLFRKLLNETEIIEGNNINFHSDLIRFFSNMDSGYIEKDSYDEIFRKLQSKGYKVLLFAINIKYSIIINFSKV